MWKKRKSSTQIFIISGVVLTSIFFIAFVFHNNLYTALLHGIKEDSFMDFFNSINHAIGREPYEWAAIYPPICYMFYWFFGILMGDDAMEILAQHDVSQLELKQLTLPMIVFLFYFTITLLLFLWLLKSMKHGKKAEKTWILIVVTLSVPFIYQFERANIIFLSLIFTMAFFLWKDSENKYLRELSLILLAIAASLKIYPAIFGLLLLSEKRYKEAVRLVIYGVVFFFLPFLFIRGGFSTVPQFLKNLTYTTTEYQATREGYKINFSALISYVAGKFSPNTLLWEVVSGKVALLLSILGICVFPWLKEHWKKVLLLTCILIGFPNMSFEYTAIFLVIPLVMFLNQEQTGKMQYAYLILFILAFFPLPIGWNGNSELYAFYFYNRSFNALQTSIALLTMMFLLVGEGGGVCYKQTISGNKKRIVAVLGVSICLMTLFGVYTQHSYDKKTVEKKEKTSVATQTLKRYGVTLNSVWYEGQYEGDVVNKDAFGKGKFSYGDKDSGFKVEGRWYKGVLIGDAKYTYPSGNYDIVHSVDGTVYGKVQSYNSVGEPIGQSWYYKNADIKKSLDLARKVNYEDIQADAAMYPDAIYTGTGKVVTLERNGAWVDMLIEGKDGNRYWCVYQENLSDEMNAGILAKVEEGDEVVFYGQFDGVEKWEYGKDRTKLVRLYTVMLGTADSDMDSLLSLNLTYDALIQNPYLFVGEKKEVQGKIVSKQYLVDEEVTCLVVETVNKEKYVIYMDYTKVFPTEYELSYEQKEKILKDMGEYKEGQEISVAGCIDKKYMEELDKNSELPAVFIKWGRDTQGAPIVIDGEIR